MMEEAEWEADAPPKKKLKIEGDEIQETAGKTEDVEIDKEEDGNTRDAKSGEQEKPNNCHSDSGDKDKASNSQDIKKEEKSEQSGSVADDDTEKSVKKKKKKKKKKPKEDAGKKSEKKAKGKKKKKQKTGDLRKNIKEIMKTQQLGEETLAAQREEAERRERINLKLQQLQQAQKAPSPPILTFPSMPDISMPNCFDDLFASFLAEGVGSSAPHQEETPPNEDIKIKENTKKVAVAEPHVTADVPEKSLVHDDVLIIPSDDSEHSKFVQHKQPFYCAELRSYLTQATHISTQDCLSESNVISISSGEEEEDKGCDDEIKCITATRTVTNGYRLPHTPAPPEVVKLDDDEDDDCVLLSPVQQEEEEDDQEDRDQYNVPDAQGRVLVNVGRPEEDPEIFLAPQIARIVKPHQIGGIRFLYDNVVESLDRFNTASGFGCILAHSMGLGKTLQAIAFCDVFLRTSRAKTVLIIVPINTIQNWLHEFNVWVPPKEPEMKRTKHRRTANNLNSLAPTMTENGASSSLSFDNLSHSPESSSHSSSAAETNAESEDLEVEEEIRRRAFEVYVLNETVKTLQAREKIITEWGTKGGVLLIGYEMYRMLALKKLKKSKKTTALYNGDDSANEIGSLNKIHSFLVDLGPDLVICDEGHRIKNSGASISQALKAIRTKRRIVLTGYPLQNNLMEYWCMVDFIRPNYLGSKVEFSNMFERPITNGQCVDSTPEDKRLMRFRSHVLHSLLEGFVQRRSHAVLRHALPEKQEWVFLLKMTPIQLRLYKEFILYLTSNLDTQNVGANPIKAFAVCCKIWNHPDALYNVLKRKQSILDDLDLDEVTGTENGCKSKNSSISRKDKDRKESPIVFFDGSGFDFSRSSSCNQAAARSGSESLSLDWAIPIFENYVPGILENGVKFEVLFEIIKETVSVGDKLLVFSQTLLSLDLVESFLQQKFKWAKNAEYYRLDGSTTGLEREKLINNFNAKKDVFVFLVSTRAGSLGVNLIGANRVVVLDASWNPCHDCQAVCRIYRYGQTKPCQIYRFVSDLTLEKRIYDRQVNKRGMSDRVVDEMNPNMQFRTKDVSSFLVLQHEHLDKLNYISCNLDPTKFSDTVMQQVLSLLSEKLTQEPFEHESLLIDQKHQRLSSAEKRLAHRNYMKEKKTQELQSASGFTYSRPSYAAYYPKDTNSQLSSYASRTPTIPNRHRSSILNSPSRPVTDDFEQHVSALQIKGICVQSLVLRKDAFLADPTGGPDMFLMAGEKIYVLRSPKGTYLRLSNGKLIAVRNNASNTRLPILSVPANQELTKEQLQTLVFSFLKVPGQTAKASTSFTSCIGYRSSSPFNQNHSYHSSYANHHPPAEQPLPPSTYYSQSKNHLQVTNSRSNSGGDILFQSSNSTSRMTEVHSNSNTSNLVRSTSSSSLSTEFSRPQNLAALLDTNSSSSSGFNSNLEKLAYLSPQRNHFSSNSTRYSPQSQFSSSVIPGGDDEVEVIPLPSPQDSRSASNFSFPSSNDTLQTSSSSIPSNSFYEDFTITVKPPKTDVPSKSNPNQNQSPGPYLSTEFNNTNTNHNQFPCTSSYNFRGGNSNNNPNNFNMFGSISTTNNNQYYNNNSTLNSSFTNDNHNHSSPNSMSGLGAGTEDNSSIPYSFQYQGS